MNVGPSQPPPDERPPETPPAHRADPYPAGPPAKAGPRRLPLWLSALGAGLLSGLISWAGGEATSVSFPAARERIYPANYAKLGGYEKQAATAMVEGAARQAAERKKSAAGFGLLGLILGVSLGLIGGRAAGSSRTAARGASIGGLAGAAVGAGLSWIAVPLFFRFDDPESGLIVLSMTHAAIFMGIGAAAGLGLGAGLGDRPSIGRALFGGVLGGLFGTIALEIVYSVAFPLMRTFEPIAPERVPRLLMYLCVAVGVALCAGLAARGRSRGPVLKPSGLD